MKRKQSNAKRDHCSICFDNGTGSSGHSAQFCAFKNGPYEGRFRDAAIASQASRQQAKKARQQRSNQQGGSSSSGGAPPELSAFLADRLDNGDVAEHGGFDAARKNPLPVPVATAFGGDAWPTYGELRGLLGVVAPIAQTSARWYVTWHEGWGVSARVR